MARRSKPIPTTTPTPPPPPRPIDLRESILADFATLKNPLRAEREGLSQQQFLHLLLAEQAAQRRERSIARRIREARLRDPKPLSVFDWEFNRAAIDRVLRSWPAATSCDNLVFVGQSGSANRS
jgi:DNA replication protein DnaC